MKLSAPTTITLRRPSADADLIISRHDDSGSNNRDARNSHDLAERQVSYSDPGSASSSADEGSHNSLLECGRLKVTEKKKKKKKCMEEKWKSGVRRASDCMREAIRRFQQQLQLCNDNRSKVN